MTLPNVLSAMQSIRTVTGEALEAIEPAASLPGASVELVLCTAILRSTWEIANDYITAIPAFNPPVNRPPSARDLGAKYIY